MTSSEMAANTAAETSPSSTARSSQRSPTAPTPQASASSRATTLATVGKIFERIDEELAAWMTGQPVFFVATAATSIDQTVNCSPKGTRGTFAVIDEHTVAYLDLTGSGVETIAHLRDNGRIVLMFCAFEGRPRIVRLHGTGTVVMPEDDSFSRLITHFSEHPGVRSVIVVDVTRAADSCGYAVPLMTYEADRDVLDLTNAKKGPERLAEYRTEKNATSIDGLPGLV